MAATDLNATHILLGVTAGIAAYKSADLVRQLTALGAQVRVAMTPGAAEFVRPLTFQALSGRPVSIDLLDAQAEAAMGHIELARWADAILIAPCSADFLARLAHGIADDLLSTVCLATEAPIFIAPAMNRRMWSNPATQTNVDVLARRGIRHLGPASGEQACGETGAGRMLEPVALAHAMADALSGDRRLADKTVVITAGPTYEPIDPVRFIGNRSSGKMGYAMAHAARRMGARVLLVSGPTALDTPWGVERIDVETAGHMYTAVHDNIAGAAIFIGVAAVADYRPDTVAPAKIKKDRDAALTMTLIRNADILASVAALAAPRPFTVGFAAETDDVRGYAAGKLARKRLDMIVANDVSNGRVFGQDQNAVLALWPGGEQALGPGDKNTLAQTLMQLIAQRCRVAMAQAAGARSNDD